MFIENIAIPFARLKIRDEFVGKLASLKSKEEHSELMSEIEKEISELKAGKTGNTKTKEEDKATGYVIEGFLDQLTAESGKDYNTAFNKPLKEPNSKAKLSIDKVAFKFRRHVFVSASVFSVFSIFVELLAK